MSGIRLSPPLSTGVTLDILRTSGTIPCEKELLNMEARASLIWLSASFIHFVGMPIVDLLTFRPLIRSETSCGQIALNMKLLEGA